MVWLSPTHTHTGIRHDGQMEAGQTKEAGEGLEGRLSEGIPSMPNDPVGAICLVWTRADEVF